MVIFVGCGRGESGAAEAVISTAKQLAKDSRRESHFSGEADVVGGAMGDVLAVEKTHLHALGGRRVGKKRARWEPWF